MAVLPNGSACSGHAAARHGDASGVAQRRRRSSSDLRVLRCGRGAACPIWAVAVPRGAAAQQRGPPCGADRVAALRALDAVRAGADAVVVHRGGLVRTADRPLRGGHQCHVVGHGVGHRGGLRADVRWRLHGARAAGLPPVRRARLQPAQEGVRRHRPRGRLVGASVGHVTDVGLGFAAVHSRGPADGHAVPTRGRVPDEKDRQRIPARAERRHDVPDGPDAELRPWGRRRRRPGRHGDNPR
mmetsp:Transcript_69215/g.200501  ORF Transcript_69215/g.200501 Transcript_69215/m.200501 type:complete len:242 (-) Transcript_69215:398-1123(-)